MPWIDPDNMDPTSNDIKCDRCGSIEDYGEGEKIAYFWRNQIFGGRPKKDFHRQTFCRACAVLMTPYVYRLRDIDELRLFVNKLERAIHESRNKDNRATSHNVGQRRQRCA